MSSKDKYYTTGVWASVSARAAVAALLGKRSFRVEVVIPSGERVVLPVRSIEISDKRAVATAVKISPEAEDVTHGAVIGAVAEFWKYGVLLEGGQGVGLVTKPGLRVPVGEKAINPVPRLFILKNVGEELESCGFTGGVKVTIFVERGERIALKTVNPKLGIVGGISILGTRGTVIPYSTKSFMDSILAELSVAAASGLKEIVFAPGRESIEYARRRLVYLPPEAFIMVGDFVFFSVKHAAKNGFRKIWFFAQPGKLAKVAFGFKNTHAKYGSLPLDWLARILDLPQVSGCNTVSEAWKRFPDRDRWRVLEELASQNLSMWGGVDCEAFLVPAVSVDIAYSKS